MDLAEEGGCCGAAGAAVLAGRGAAGGHLEDIVITKLDYRFGEAMVERRKSSDRLVAKKILFR